MKEITYDELSGLPKDSYVLIDIRDDGLTAFPKDMSDTSDSE